MDISIVIVNYNVKAYLLNLIDSVKKSKGNFTYEIIVVDNASVDGSVESLQQNHPDVKIVENKRNIGFGRANNLGVKEASGRYVLILNPDTILNEDTLSEMVHFMENHPDVGISTCRILNADGSFSNDTFRNKPTPVSALLRVFGLEEKLGKGKHAYYIKDVNIDEVQDIPVISGAFMFLRSDVFESVDGFDERFFMYFEDTDLCYRVSESGYRIVYVPSSSVVHFRGESTRKDKIDHHLIFNKALYQFYQKHYSQGYSFLFRIMINLGIVFRAGFIYLKDVLSRIFPVLFDIAVLNILIVISFILRYDLSIEPTALLESYEPEYFGINALITVLYVSISQYYQVYTKYKFSMVALFKTILWTFGGVALITFFLRDFAFSRLILGVGMLASFAILLSVRLIRRGKKTQSNSLTAYTETSVILVGYTEYTDQLIAKIRSKLEQNYKIIGLVADNLSVDETVESVPVLGHTKHLAELAKLHQADQIMYQVEGVGQKTILQSMTKLVDTKIATRLIPKNHDFILGKNTVDYFGQIPVVDVDIQYQVPWNRFVKRSFDILVGGLLSVILCPFLLAAMISDNKADLELFDEGDHLFTLQFKKDPLKASLMNIALWSWYIFKGNVSVVGAPITKNSPRKFPYYKFGPFSYRTLHEHKHYHEEEKERLELFYLQNYAIWKDFEVIVGYLERWWKS